MLDECDLARLNGEFEARATSREPVRDHMANENEEQGKKAWLLYMTFSKKGVQT